MKINERRAMAQMALNTNRAKEIGGIGGIGWFCRLGIDSGTESVFAAYKSPYSAQKNYTKYLTKQGYTVSENMRTATKDGITYDVVLDSNVSGAQNCKVI